MSEVEPMKIDSSDERKTIIGEVSQRKKQLKRKRLEPCLFSPSPEEKQSKIVAYRNEIDSLIKFCKDLGLESRGELFENLEKVGSSLNGVIACLMEESGLPLSKLVDEILEKVKGRNGISENVSKASVKSTVLIIGQRLSYGVISPDADVLEDEDEFALWCWETRDLKLMPKSMRAYLKVRRTCRKKIQERITAVMAIISALEKFEDRPSCPQELMKASEKLSKVLNEADIRLLIENMSQKSGAEMAEKDAKREEKLLIKQMEKNKREMEKERKKMDRELQKEKLQSEKELKRLHDEAEKEERRRDKEDNEMQKQLKRHQEEAEKEQKRKEKEEAESRKRLALKKQASLMERFLKRSKACPLSQNNSPINKCATSTPSVLPEKMPESVTQAMDSVFAQNGEVEAQDIWSSHLNAWRCIGRSMHSNRKMHWGIRQKPKTELVKELKLTTNQDDDMKEEKLTARCVDSNADRMLSDMDTDSSSRPCDRRRFRVKKLLQFDKSNRPAFYGVYPKESQVVGGRHPYVKDPDIEYEIDSDEEWEEEEPGESLSDCEKDEEETMEGCVKDDDDAEDESEDGFFVPDGYLSDNEGANADEMESDDLVEEVRSPSNSVHQVKNEEFCTLLRQQKHLNNFTEHALKKNQPLIILNLMHEKTTLLSADELTGPEKIERTCLQALSIRPLPGFSDIGISIRSDVVDEDNEAHPDKPSTTRLANGVAAILDSDLPQIISIIQSCPISIGKIEKALHDKFPAVPKSHLKNKVRVISDFYDNRWQVKKEILSKYGISEPQERTRGKTKSIALFLKRCMPPSGNNVNPTETSP
ncbi:hypothetical protein CASFOL_006496 [Castilleja foliolosa]|uniref:Chromatin assembly factor 1 subunit FAS1 n=1 Tax=Castilleja foliolosa TaxID=1961234 RepID=A0ABD3E6J6_9LAMI